MFIVEHDLNGSKAARSAFPAMPAPESATVTLSGVHYRLDATGEPIDHRRSIMLDEKTLARGVCFLGAPRTGKTNAIMRCVSQIKQLHMRADRGKLIVLDVKGEYHAAFADHASVSLGVFEQKTRWNLFRDILAWGTDAAQISVHTKQLCEYLYDGQLSQTAPFFVHAAKIVTACIIEGWIRRALETGDDSRLNHRDLKEYLCSMQIKDLIKALHEYEDFKSAVHLLVEKALLKPDGWEFVTNKDGNGVYAEIVIMTNRIFQGAFGEKGDFSIVSFLKKDGMSTLFLVSSPSVADVTAPVFKYLIDAAVDALGENITRGEQVCFVLDEFAQLDELKKLPRQMSLLPYQNACFIVGLQNVAQVRAVYGEANTANLMDLFQTVICLNAPPPTVEYMRQRCGKFWVRRAFSGPDGGIQQEIKEMEVVESQEIMSLKPGEAFVRMPNGECFQFKFDLY